MTKGAKVAVTINQLDANGAGPYTCDMDQTGNSLGSGQLNLTTAETDANGATSLTITMPSDLACVGGECTFPLSFPQH